MTDELSRATRRHDVVHLDRACANTSGRPLHTRREYDSLHRQTNRTIDYDDINNVRQVRRVSNTRSSSSGEDAYESAPPRLAEAADEAARRSKDAQLALHAKWMELCRIDTLLLRAVWQAVIQRRQSHRRAAQTDEKDDDDAQWSKSTEEGVEDSSTDNPRQSTNSSDRSESITHDQRADGTCDHKESHNTLEKITAKWTTEATAPSNTTKTYHNAATASESTAPTVGDARCDRSAEEDRIDRGMMSIAQRQAQIRQSRLLARGSYSERPAPTKAQPSRPFIPCARYPAPPATQTQFLAAPQPMQPLSTASHASASMRTPYVSAELCRAVIASATVSLSAQRRRTECMQTGLASSSYFLANNGANCADKENVCNRALVEHKDGTSAANAAAAVLSSSSSMLLLPTESAHCLAGSRSFSSAPVDAHHRHARNDLAILPPTGPTPPALFFAPFPWAHATTSQSSNSRLATNCSRSKSHQATLLTRRFSTWRDNHVSTARRIRARAIRAGPSHRVCIAEAEEQTKTCTNHTDVHVPPHSSHTQDALQGNKAAANAGTAIDEGDAKHVGEGAGSEKRPRAAVRSVSKTSSICTTIRMTDSDEMDDTCTEAKHPHTLKKGEVSGSDENDGSDSAPVSSVSMLILRAARAKTLRALVLCALRLYRFRRIYCHAIVARNDRAQCVKRVWLTWCGYTHVQRAHRHALLQRVCAHWTSYVQRQQHRRYCMHRLRQGLRQRAMAYRVCVQHRQAHYWARWRIAFARHRTARAMSLCADALLQSRRRTRWRQALMRCVYHHRDASECGRKQTHLIMEGASTTSAQLPISLDAAVCVSPSSSLVHVQSVHSRYVAHCILRRWRAVCQRRCRVRAAADALYTRLLIRRVRYRCRARGEAHGLGGRVAAVSVAVTSCGGTGQNTSGSRCGIDEEGVAKDGHSGQEMLDPCVTVVPDLRAPLRHAFDAPANSRRAHSTSRSTHDCAPRASESTNSKHRDDCDSAAAVAITATTTPSTQLPVPTVWLSTAASSPRTRVTTLYRMQHATQRAQLTQLRRCVARWWFCYMHRCAIRWHQTRRRLWTLRHWLSVLHHRRARRAQRLAVWLRWQSQLQRRECYWRAGVMRRVAVQTCVLRVWRTRCARRAAYRARLQRCCLRRWWERAAARVGSRVVRQRRRCGLWAHWAHRTRSRLACRHDMLLALSIRETVLLVGSFRRWTWMLQQCQQRQLRLRIMDQLRQERLRRGCFARWKRRVWGGMAVVPPVGRAGVSSSPHALVDLNPYRNHHLLDP